MIAHAPSHIPGISRHMGKHRGTRFLTGPQNAYLREVVARLRKTWTQEQIAARAGIDQPTLSKFIKGTQGTSWPVAWALLDMAGDHTDLRTLPSDPPPEELPIALPTQPVNDGTDANRDILADALEKRGEDPDVIAALRARRAEPTWTMRQWRELYDELRGALASVGRHTTPPSSDDPKLDDSGLRPRKAAAGDGKKRRR